MRKLILLFIMASVCAMLFTSCIESRSSACPSHDPNYFRRR